MRKRLVVVSVLLLLAGLVLLGISLENCRARPEPEVRAVDLLVDISAFPLGWFVQGGPISAHDNFHILEHEDARDYASVGFAPPEAKFPYEVTASQTIWNFGNSVYAAIEFYTRFRPEGPTTPKVLQGWSYHSKAANRFRLYCTHRTGYVRCVAIAQYGPFISLFSAPIGAAYNMTTEDLERVLKAIDERMAQRLGKPLPTVPVGTVTPAMQ
ncbi:MAG: hypothetical protein H5T63_06475 [Chloroflexi bacterium]|nr:hypothetical protein [Chloroflexota bacterium]